MGADDFRALGLVGDEIVHLGDGAIEGRHGKTMVVHVQNQILAHHGQPDKSDVSLWFHLLYSLKFEKNTLQKPALPCQQFFGGNRLWFATENNSAGNQAYAPMGSVQINRS